MTTASSKQASWKVKIMNVLIVHFKIPTKSINLQSVFIPTLVTLVLLYQPVILKSYVEATSESIEVEIHVHSYSIIFIQHSRGGWGGGELYQFSQIGISFATGWWWWGRGC